MTMCKCGQDARFSHACPCAGLSSAVDPIFITSAPTPAESVEVLALRAEVERLTRERDEAMKRASVAKGASEYEARRADAAEAREAEAREEVERMRAARRETSRNVCLGRVYYAAQEILQFLPVPGWEHSAEASGAYERLAGAVREMKRNVKQRRRAREKRAARVTGGEEG